jgi:tRNA (mo5U34)-methyltransferase
MLSHRRQPTTSRDNTRLRELVAARLWFHRIDLGDGIVTPGVDDSSTKLQWIGLPEDLTGQSVLDIGSYDGFFAFEAERRGASRTAACDYFCWTLPGMGDGRGFDIAHQALGSKVEKHVMRVEEISPERLGMFDVILFLGVLYHAPDPLRYLRNVYSVCRNQLILETHIDAVDDPRPVMVFYPGDSLNKDPSNFWGPNPACVAAMLKEVGFSRVEEVGIRGERLVVHAFR